MPLQPHHEPFSSLSRGKTYNALRRLSESKSGCYCGPLRLLAWEVHEKMCEGAIGGNKIECDLVTGQEKVLFDGSTHRSSTIEMVDLQTRMQVGVVDEIQMVGDVNRGWAWTRAVLGLPVEELHICGEVRAMAVVHVGCMHAPILLSLTHTHTHTHAYKQPHARKHRDTETHSQRHTDTDTDTHSLTTHSPLSTLTLTPHSTLSLSLEFPVNFLSRNPWCQDACCDEVCSPETEC